jgi:hypothetical protein
MTDADTTRHHESPPVPRTLWFALAAGPVAWALHLLLGYGWASLFACGTGARWPLHLISVAFALVAIAGALLGWSAWRRSELPAGAALTGQGGWMPFLAVVATMLGVVGLLGVLFGWAPAIVLDRCA